MHLEIELEQTSNQPKHIGYKLKLQIYINFSQLNNLSFPSSNTLSTTVAQK